MDIPDEEWGKKIQGVEFWKNRYEIQRKEDENFEYVETHTHTHA